MTYTAKVKKFPFDKKYTCKGHVLIPENSCVMLVLENEKRVFIPNRYIIEFDDGWFKMELAKTRNESHGNASVTHGLDK